MTMRFNASCGNRTHAFCETVGLKSTPLDRSGKDAYDCSDYNFITLFKWGNYHDNSPQYDDTVFLYIYFSMIII